MTSAAQIQPGLGTRDDAELLRETARGDRDAFLTLYDRFSPRLLGVINATLRDSALADDVLQVVMLEIWRSHAVRYSPALGSAEAWLLRLARSRAIDAARRRSRRSAADLDATPEPVARLASEPLSSDSSLARAISSLSEDERQPLLLAFAVGLTREQIATHLNVPVGTVKTRIHRAVGNLRRAIPS
ncbi:MAG: RNA polymerase sigma factor [Phycisphaerales bacterium]